MIAFNSGPIVCVEERATPDLLAKSPSRRRRVANGSGRSQEQVSQMVSQLFQMRARMKNLMSMMQGGSIPGLDNLEESLKGARKVQCSCILR